MMKNLKNILIVLLIFSLLILTSCVSTTTSGTGGLRVSMLSNLPPTKLYDGQDLRVVLEVENTGDYPIGKSGDSVYISGFSPNIITGLQDSGEPIPGLEEK